MDLLGIRPNRRSGQNFLVHRSMAEKFVSKAEEAMSSRPNTVVEIGPGLGQITSVLCERFTNVIGIEKDRRIVKLWQDKLQQAENFKLVADDATCFDYAKLAKDTGERLTVFGNLPFSVSTQILEHLLNSWQHIAFAHLTFQKEVALRILAKPGNRDYGSLTIWTHIYCDVKSQMIIKKDQYYPVPKVDSQVVAFDFLEQPRIDAKQSKSFETFVRQLFLYRRKTLLNGLKQTKRYASQAASVKTFLEKQHLSATARVETLDFKTLYDMYVTCIESEGTK